MREEFQEKVFKSEEDEADWWDQHQDALAEEFQQAASVGTLGHGTAIARINSD